jgi:hypothetical protein
MGTSPRSKLEGSPGLTSGAVGLPAKTSATLGLGVAGLGSRDPGVGSPTSGLGSSLSPSQALLFGKTSMVQRGDIGCPSCGASCTPSGTPACRFECEPVTLVRRLEARGSSSLRYLPRPTATANQLAPSMRKHWSCRNLQDLVGRTGGSPHPRLWEWLMGFEEGWTACDASGTP